jgi:hypothetical protein
VAADHEVPAIAAVVDKLDLRGLYPSLAKRRRRRLARPHGHRARQADLQAARAATAETVNADAKAHRGMAATALRGLDEVTAGACLFALTYNTLRFIISAWPPNAHRRPIVIRRARSPPTPPAHSRFIPAVASDEPLPSAR